MGQAVSAWEGSEWQHQNELRREREALAKKRCPCCTSPPHLHNLQIPDHSPDCPDRPKPVRATGVQVARSLTATLTPADLRRLCGAPADAVVRIGGEVWNGTLSVSWSES